MNLQVYLANGISVLILVLCRSAAIGLAFLYGSCHFLIGETKVLLFYSALCGAHHLPWLPVHQSISRSTLEICKFQHLRQLNQEGAIHYFQKTKREGGEGGELPPCCFTYACKLPQCMLLITFDEANRITSSAKLRVQFWLYCKWWQFYNFLCLHLFHLEAFRQIFNIYVA